VHVLLTLLTGTLILLPVSVCFHISISLVMKITIINRIRDRVVTCQTRLSGDQLLLFVKGMFIT